MTYQPKKFREKPYLREEVEKHNKTDDLWLIIGLNIYDVSSYHEKHPGGSQIMLKYAGQDATKGFNQANHPQEVAKILREHQVGIIASKEHLWQYVITVIILGLTLYSFVYLLLHSTHIQRRSDL